MPPRRAFFAFHRLIGQNSIIAKLFPNCLFLSHVQPNWQKRFVVDGEAAILGVEGHSDFNALHSGKHNDEVRLMAL
jgi:hypothetical protein